MGDHRLSTTQRNQIYEIAIHIGLDPASFEWHEEHDAYKNLIHRIVHQPTGAFLRLLHFVRAGGSGYFSFDYWPKTVKLESVGDQQWDGLRIRLAMWLKAVKAESDAPDLWQLARQERAWLGATEADDVQNSPFTSA